MRVEACCQSLLAEILPAIDPKREGICLDVGVGTFELYCQNFADLGFTTVAIEPLPIAKVRRICQQKQITLIESCLSNQDGQADLYLGEFAGLFNSNFSSLSPDWFGSSGKVKKVKTLSLETLINTLQAEKITGLKLDIEGWESLVIEQLQAVPKFLLPKVIMFEYGGGANKQKGTKGWSRDFQEKTITCLETLKRCGYNFSIIIDFAVGSREKIVELQSIDDLESLFSDRSVYGNILSFYHCDYPRAKIAEICQPYYRIGLIDYLICLLVSQRFFRF